MRFAGTELGNYMSTPDFTGLGRTMMQGQSLQRRAAHEAEGMVGMAGINSQAKIKSAGYQADAIRAEGAAQGQAAMASGIGNMVSGIAGGFASRGGGGGGVFGNPTSSDRYTLDLNTANNWSQSGGATYWDSSMPINMSILRN